MHKIVGNNGKKNISKVMSIFLSVLALVQFPISVSGKNVHDDQSSKSYLDDKTFDYDDYDDDGESKLSKFVKKHPFISAALPTILVSVPMMAYLSELRCSQEYDSRRIIELEYNYNDLCRRMSRLNNLSRNLGMSGGDVEELRRELNELTDLIFGTYGRPGMRERLDRVEQHSSEEVIDDILRQVTRLSAAIDGAHGAIRDPAFREQLSEIYSNLAEINARLNIRRERRYIEARNLGRTAQNCQLSNVHGQVYVGNAITRTNVNVQTQSQSRLIGQKLNELCNQYGVIRGISCGADNEFGWEKSPYQYYFVGNDAKFFAIDDSKRTLLAQMITVMYDHKNEANWREVIQNTLATLAAHGGHCSWRAQALVDQAYSVMRNGITSAGLDRGEEGADITEMDRLFSMLKDRILEKARNRFLDDHRGEREPLLAFNNISLCLENMMGMSHGVLARSYRDAAVELLNRFTSKEEIIQTSNDLLISTFHEDQDLMDRTLFENVNQTPISFARYCNIVGKKRNDIERLVNFISGNDCDNENLKSWANGEIELPLNDIYRNLMIEITDADGVGVSEMGYWRGVKFLVKCYNENYLENRAD